MSNFLFFLFWKYNARWDFNDSEIYTDKIDKCIFSHVCPVLRNCRHFLPDDFPDFFNRVPKKKGEGSIFEDCSPEGARPDFILFPICATGWGRQHSPLASSLLPAATSLSPLPFFRYSNRILVSIFLPLYVRPLSAIFSLSRSLALYRFNFPQLFQEM